MNEIHYMLGQLMERSGHLLSALSDHKQEMRQAMKYLDRRLSHLERNRYKPPAAEIAIKRVITWLMPIGTLIMTGSWEKALAVLRAIGGN